MAVLAPAPKFIAFDGDGDPIPNAKIYTYEAGTTTPKATYTSASAGTPNANPVICDSAGRCEMWLVGAYKLEFRSAVDALIWTVDNITSASPEISTSTFAGLGAASTAGVLKKLTDQHKGVMISNGTYWGDLSQVRVDARDFGVRGDDVECGAAIQAFVNYCMTNHYDGQFPFGQIAFDGSIYFGYDVVNNNATHGMAVSDLCQGRCTFYGWGKGSLTGDSSQRLRTTLHPATTTAVPIIAKTTNAIGSIRNFRLDTLQIYANTANYVLDGEGWNGNSGLTRVNIRNASVAGSGVRLLGTTTGSLHSNYFEDVWIENGPHGNVGTRGFVFANNTTVGAGNNRFTNVTVAEFDYGMVHGLESPTFNFSTTRLQCTTFQTCSFQDNSGTNLFIGGGSVGTLVSGCYSENPGERSIWIKNRAQATTIIGGRHGGRPGTTAHIHIGDAANADADAKHVYGMTIIGVELPVIEVCGILREPTSDSIGFTVMDCTFWGDHAAAIGMDLQGAAGADAQASSFRSGNRFYGTFASEVSNGSKTELLIQDRRVTMAARLQTFNAGNISVTGANQTITLPAIGNLFSLLTPSGAASVENIAELDTAGMAVTVTEMTLVNESANTVTFVHNGGGTGKFLMRSGANVAVAPGQMFVCTKVGGGVSPWHTLL